MAHLTDYERRANERIVATGEAALARWSAINPMRKIVEANVATARAKLAGVL